MGDRSVRVNVEGFDWATALPVVHLFQCFRMAIQPAKLGLALLLIGAVLAYGHGLDLLWGEVLPLNESAAVSPYQVREYVTSNWAGYVDAPRFGEARPSGGGLLIERPETQQLGIFETALALETAAFDRLVDELVQLDFGVAAVLGRDDGETAPLTPRPAPARADRDKGALGALITMLLVVPGWWATTHPVFFALFALGQLLIAALLGGAICRLAAVEACRDVRASAIEGLRFAGRRFPWLVAAPLIPLLVAGGIALLMAIAGAILFNMPLLDVVGALGYGLMLLGGFMITLVLIGLAVGMHLLFPAIGVEGTDAFDTLSRAYNYILGRPWRYLLYTAVMLVYGALTYLFLALIVYGTLAVTHWLAGLWVSELRFGVSRLDAIVSAPGWGDFSPTVAQNEAARAESASVPAASWLAWGWVQLLAGLLAGYAVSYYFSAHTWIYLLLRRAADGTEFDDLYLPADQPPGISPTDDDAGRADTDTRRADTNQGGTGEGDAGPTDAPQA